MVEDRPSCFGIPEHCMPRDENGIIQPQENCRFCDHLRECLQKAIAASGGVEKLKYDSLSESEKSFESEKSGDQGGIVGAILRWSERKRNAQKGGTK
jgi:hypothetical protein